MDMQEAVKHMGEMGFQDVTAEHNAENRSDFAFVFFYPIDGSEGFRACCDDEQGIFQVLGILEEWLGRFESQGSSRGSHFDGDLQEDGEMSLSELQEATTEMVRASRQLAARLSDEKRRAAEDAEFELFVNRSIHLSEQDIDNYYIGKYPHVIGNGHPDVCLCYECAPDEYREYD